jgi:hypothetical protein
MELVRTAAAEIMVEAIEYDEMCDQYDEQFPLASMILNKFTLKG